MTGVGIALLELADASRDRLDAVLLVSAGGALVTPCDNPPTGVLASNAARYR
jgi:hypothetical protein